MNGFIFRVCAYHGEPVVLNGSGVPHRAGLSVETPITGDKVVNDPLNEIVIDVANGHGKTDYDIAALIEDFQDEYGCKVNYQFDILEPTNNPGVFEFDVFEPSWENEDEAKDVVDDLSDRLHDWAEGFPQGR